MFILAAAMVLLCGSTQAAQFALGFDGCPASKSSKVPGEAVNYTVTGNLTSAVDGADGAQGWSFGVAVTNGDFAGFDTAITIKTLYQKTSGGALTEKDLVIDDAGFYAAELVPLEGAVKTGFTTGIAFSTSKKQVLNPTGTVQTVNLQVHSTIPADESPKTVGVAYTAGLQGSGQPVDNVITLNSESVTPDLVGCDTTLQLEVVKPEFNLALTAKGVAPAAKPAATVYTKTEIKADTTVAPVTVPVQVVISTANIDETTAGAGKGDGPQGWSLSITGDNAAGTYSNPDVCGLHVTTIYEKVKGSPDYNYDFDLCDAGFNETAVTVDGKGVVSAIVFSTSKKQVLHANVADTILGFDYTLPVGGDPVTASLFFQDGGQGAGQPVNNVVTYNTASMTPPTLTFQALSLTINPVIQTGPGSFIRGNPNGDAKIDIADAIFIVYAVVPGLDTTGIYALPCKDAADANQDGSVNLADAIFLIDYEFRGGPAPIGMDACSSVGATPESCPKGSYPTCP